MKYEVVKLNSDDEGDQLNNLRRIVDSKKRDQLSPFQNGMNCRLGLIVAFWNLGRIVQPLYSITLRRFLNVVCRCRDWVKPRDRWWWLGVAPSTDQTAITSCGW